MLRAALIVVLGFIAFGSMLTSPFRFMDDRLSIVENPLIKSTANLPELFREGYFHDRSYYRPLINLSFMAEYHLFGLKSFFYNLDNLILHILNAFLVVLLVSRLTNNLQIGFWTGFLFVMHPVQWEAVCNVPGRAILLSAFFELSSFVLFLEFNRRRQWMLLPLVLGAFFLSLLCKESAGVLPLVIMAYLALDQGKSWGQKLQSLWPFAAAIMAYMGLRQYFGITHLHQSSQPMLVILGFMTFLRSVITDLRLFILPVDLHYDRSLPFMMSLRQPEALATAIFWIIALGFIMAYIRRIPLFVIFLMAWFILELLPVSQLVASIGVGAGHISTAEHFLYLASIPVFTGLVMAARWCYEKNFLNPVLWKLAVGGFLAFLLLISIEQSIYASNEYTMISRSLSYEPYNARLQAEMAMLSVSRHDILDAEKHFRAATLAEPLNPKFHAGLGTTLCQQGRWIEGMEQFVAFEPIEKDKASVERQEKITIRHIQAQLAGGKNFNARGWLAIGIYYAKIGQNKQAIAAFLNTVQLNPVQPDAWFNLGSLYEADHNWPAAQDAYQKLLTLHDITDFQRDFATQHLAYVEIHHR